MKTKKLITIILAVFLILTNAVGCDSQKKDSGKMPAEGNTLLKIGSLPIEDNLPILVAQQKGYFEQEDLEIELVMFQSPVESQSAFQSGQLDGMITDMIIAALLKGSGEDIRVTSLTLGAVPTEGRFALIASPQSTIQSVSDLKGKSIGISSNSIIEYVTDGLLLQGGMDPAEVEKIITPKIPVRIEMLLNNQIDAITVPDPHVSYVEAQGAKVIVQDTEGENLSQAVLVLQAKAIKEKEESIKRFYQAYAKAVEDINTNPGEYKELLRQNVNIPPIIADSYKIQNYPNPQLPAEKEVNNIINWLNKKKLLKYDVRYEELVQKGLF